MNPFFTIRIVTTYKSTSSDLHHVPWIDSYPAAYETLYHGKPFTCATTGEVFDAVPPPVAVFLDVRIPYCAKSLRSVYSYFDPLQIIAMPQLLQATRALSGTSVPIIGIMSSPATSFLRYFSPPSLGGVFDIKSLDDEAARLGVPSDELGEKVRYPPVAKAR